MPRAYAMGIGAGTQVLTNVPYFFAVGQPDTHMRALLLGLGWAINFVAAEWIIYRRQRPAAMVARAL